jgi:hypothetical protein
MTRVGDYQDQDMYVTQFTCQDKSELYYNILPTPFGFNYSRHISFYVTIIFIINAISQQSMAK